MGIGEITAALAVAVPLLSLSSPRSVRSQYSEEGAGECFVKLSATC